MALQGLGAGGSEWPRVLGLRRACLGSQAEPHLTWAVKGLPLGA